MRDIQGGALGEWRRNGPIALAGCLGYSAVGLQVYALGPFVLPLEAEFGWSRAGIMTGLTISSTIGVLLNFVVGSVVDKLGPRPVGIAGLALVCAAFALLGTATGSMLNWALLWLPVAFGVLLAQSTVWANAVADRFHASRGLALAVVLSGSSLAGAVLPVLASALIAGYGWRTAFAAIGVCYAALTLPPVLLFFGSGRPARLVRSARERRGIDVAMATPAAPGLSVADGLRTRAFWQLFIAAFIFAFYTMAISPNLVPLLEEKGPAPQAAARIAAVVGVVGIVSRIAAGHLIDRLPAHLLGAAVFLLPVAGCAALIADAPPTVLLVLAVVSFGVTIGAEFDVTFYLASRHFGLRSYGALIGALLTAGSLGGAVAPVASGWIHDVTHSYDSLLAMLMVLLVIAALALVSLGRPPAAFADAVP